MLRFVIRRVLWTIPVILLVILMTFVMMRQIKGNTFSPNLQRKYHLDTPWYVQYAYYVKGVFTFDLGPSITQRNRTVVDVITDAFPVSLKLGLFALTWALLLGIPLGIIAALKPNTIFDHATMAFVTASYALPSFLVSTLLIYFFALKLKDYTHFPTNGWGGWHSWILPAIALGQAPMTVFAQLVRGSMLETLQQDYIRTAQAKGLRRKRIIVSHALRNSLIPVVTVAAPVVGLLITGSFIVEWIFGIPGLARYTVTSVFDRDYPVVQGITVFYAIIVISANLVVDILYGYLDPRIRDAST